MPSPFTIELPEGYYLDNFQAVLATVLSRYDDLLDESERFFAQQFNALPVNSARLLVRFYTRKGPLFRSSRLNYAEIPDPNQALAVLEAFGLISLDPELSPLEVARLLTLPELRQLDWVTEKKFGKKALLERLQDSSERAPASHWVKDERIILPLHWTVVRKLQLLYFGNEQQSLTEFVLADLGLFRYEQYSLARKNRWFKSRTEVDQHLAVNDLKAEAQVAEESGDLEQLAGLADTLLAQPWCEAVRARVQRLGNRIGFRLEQWGDLDTALALFLDNDQPPARERRCRILYKQANFEAAWQELEATRLAPRDSTEVRFVSRFQPRLARKLKQAVMPPAAAILTEHRQRWPAADMCVEQLACHHLENAWWFENSLPLAVFGLIHWPLIFADVPGAFHHPFQTGPSDLYHPEFLVRRNTSRTQLASAIDQSKASALLQQHWHSKQGLMNPFVHWQALDECILFECFGRVPWAHWQAIFDHLWLDLRRYRSGFPDLFQLTEDGYRWIEIKGPGDRLQDNQRDWLQYFAQNGIPAEVWYIDYC